MWCFFVDLIGGWLVVVLVTVVVVGMVFFVFI